jgi:purine-binding chemotaxis protein CheW
MSTANDNLNENLTEYVTVMIGDQLFGLPISRVHDVFMPERLTRVPLASPEIAGVLNLRGRIVTAIDMRRRLGLAPRDDGQSLIDSVGEVLKLADSTREANPVNLDSQLTRVSAGVHRLDGQLLVVLDVDRMLDMGSDALAA